MIRLMYDNLIIAEQKGTKGKYRMELVEGVDPFFVPKHLFRNGAKSVPLLDFVKFVEKRVFPKERVDCADLLDKMGLKEYKPYKIAEKTKACLMEDGWWVAFSDKDSFRLDTVRGRAGFPEWKSVRGKNYFK